MDGWMDGELAQLRIARIANYQQKKISRQRGFDFAAEQYTNEKYEFSFANIV